MLLNTGGHFPCLSASYAKTLERGGATSAQVKMSSSVMVDVRRPVEVPSVMQRCHTVTGGAALATTVKGRLVRPQLV